MLLHFHRRTASESQYENTEVEELLAMLRETDQLEEQGDILHHLVTSLGLDYVTGIDCLIEHLNFESLKFSTL